MAEIQAILEDDSEASTIVQLPPNVDRLTDEEESEDEDVSAQTMKEVAGPMEVHYSKEPLPSSQSAKSPEDVEGIPGPSGFQKGKSQKKRRLTFEEPKWIHKQPDYTKLQTLETTITNLNDLEAKTPLLLFEEILDDEICSFIIQESIKYAIGKGEMNVTFTVRELKTFFGIPLLSSYHQLPSEKFYWSDTDDLGVSIVKNAMSRNQFLKIKSFIHFNDNDLAEEQKNDRAFKIRPLISMINKSFQKFGIFEQNISIDEMIVEYFGRNRLKQFIRGKPIRFGYKFWVLCGSSGYCFNFDLYCGAEKNENADLPLGSRVVLNMLSCVLKPRCHVVYFDNFFTSRDLLVHLRELGFRATGTVRENRTSGCPLQESKSLQKEARGQYDYRFDKNGEVLFVRWNDNRCVTLGTNHDFVEPVNRAPRYSRAESKKVGIPQPNLIKAYNQNMGGVDQHDWFCGKYPIAVRGKKWYWCLFTRILTMAVVNSWIIYRRIHGAQSLSLLEFHRAVAVTYLKQSCRSEKKNRKTHVPRPIMDLRYDNIGHVIKKRPNQRRCQFESCTGRPRTYCSKCDVTLCLTCFASYHVKQ